MVMGKSGATQWMRAIPELFILLFSALLFCSHGEASGNRDFPLTSRKLQARISRTTGQVLSLSEVGGSAFLSASEDLYDLGGKSGTEAGDRVISQETEKGGLTFECDNRELGLRLVKRYHLEGNLLIKQVSYTREEPDKALLKVSSQSLFDPVVYAKGYYYTPVDDGYKVRTVPFLPSSDITVVAPWTISTGSLVFYSPQRKRVFTHYRYRVNEDYCYGEVENIKSEYVPGGAITALGQGFIGAKTPLTLESRYVLLDGDPRAYHRHICSQPPCTDWKNRPVPDWFKHVRMYFGDGYPGCGRGLMENTEAVAKDLMSFLKLVPEDQYVMVCFNHWSTSGDYPYQGTFRYYLYSPAEWSKSVPVEQLKEKIRYLKSLSPRIKVGGYFFYHPAAGTPPYEQHKDWFLQDETGALVSGGDGIGQTAIPNFTGPYRDYILDQLKHAVTDLGFDWLHLDTAVAESVDWRTRTVVQSRELARLYDELSRFCTAHNAAMVQNVAWTTSLWSHGGYLECQQPDRWEKRDWRILGVSGYANALYRTNRPGTWVNLVYGCAGDYGIRNAFTGMRGWIRNAMHYWTHIAMSLARENVVDELLDTKLSPVEVHPCWWSLETDKLEAMSLQSGSAHIIPVILHDSEAREESLSLASADLKFRPGCYTFGMDLRLSPPEPLDAFKPVPWRDDYVTLTQFATHRALPARYTHRMRLEPRTNNYHVLTQTPAWVYSVSGRRTALLLPENRGVKISGILPVGASHFSLAVESSADTAQLLAYMPAEWTSADTRVNGVRTSSPTIRVLDQRCVLINVGRGRSEIVLAKSAPSAKPQETAYANPQSAAWTEASERVFYYGLTHRAYEDNGKSCLELTGNGSARFPFVGGREAGGIALQVRGENSGSRLQVGLEAGDAWTYDITDNFKGWKEFVLYRDQMSTSGSGKKWGPTTFIALTVQPSQGKSMHIANLRLLPARPGDFPREEIARKHVSALLMKTSPILNGSADQPCWRQAQAVTDFFGYAKGKTDSQTSVRVCYDSENLYVRFENMEPIESRGAPQRRDAEIWNTNHVELYLDPFHDGVQYFQLLVDPAGTIEDVRITRTGRSFDWNGDFEVNTYLNWKASWVAEYKIPFRILEKTPKPGDRWGINFARKDISGELSNWATSTEWLDPANFGEVEFGNEKAPAVAVGERVPADPDLLFHASFDGSVKPDLQTGKGAFDATEGLQFTEGRSGKALVIGHNFGVRYPVTGNVSLDAGTISFWVKPINWNHNQQLFHHFVNIQSSGEGLRNDARPFSVLLYKFWEWDSVVAFGMTQWFAESGLFEVPMNDTWVPGKWHQIVFTWDRVGQRLYSDGEGVGRRYNGKAPDVLNAKTIQVGGPYFKANDALTAIDELRIHRRCLQSAEVKALYLRGDGP